MRTVAARGLPPAPLAAQQAFLADVFPAVEAAIAAGEDTLIVFDAADHTHREWRLAAVAMLARAHTPRRINAVAGAEGTAALAGAVAYLSEAPGVTGQLLDLSA